MSLIEVLYLCSGLMLPLFYAPQIAKLLHDRTDLASYSLSKAAVQGALRFPALLFGLFVVQNNLFVLIVSLDLLGRTAEFFVAIASLLRQGSTPGQIFCRLLPAHAFGSSTVHAISQANNLAPDEPLVVPQHSTGQI